MQGCRPRRPGRCLGLVRAWGRVRPHARRYAARLRYPRSGVVGDVLPVSRSAPRRPRPAGRRAVTSFRHAPCLAAPGVPLRCVVGDATAPGRGRPSAVVLPRASVLPSRSGLVMPRARGRARGPPSPPLPDSAPGWTPGLARSALGRAACARTLAACCASAVRRGAVGGRPGWTPGRSAAVLRWSPASLALNTLPPPLPCRLRLGRRRRSGRPVRPASGLGVTLLACLGEASARRRALLASPEAWRRLALLHALYAVRLRHGRDSPPPGGLDLRLVLRSLRRRRKRSAKQVPASGCSESESGRAREGRQETWQNSRSQTETQTADADCAPVCFALMRLPSNPWTVSDETRPSIEGC